MKILLDFTFPGSCAAGLEVWTQNFIHSLAAIDNINQYVIFGFFMRNFSHRKKTVGIPEQDNFSLYVRKFPRPFIVFLEDHNISVIEKLLLRQNIDIYHGTGYFLPCLKKIKGIVTVHGLDFAEMDTYWYKDKWYKNVPLYLRRADKIIAVSNYVKVSLMRYYGIPQRKIQVIYPGIGKEFNVIESKKHLETFKEKFGILQPYILTVATSVERKNLKRTLEAFSLVKHSHRNLKLVIVGDREVIQVPILPYVEKLGLQNEVYFPGYLKPEELVYLYNLAEVFVFPSLYEGFGLPVLEAMACGCPVVTSNVSALPEVAGDAAIVVDPYNVEEIESALKRILSDDKLREVMKKKGEARAKLFSWEKCARETLEVYKELSK